MDKIYLAAKLNQQTGKYDVPIAQGTVTDHQVVDEKTGFETKAEADNWALCQIIDSIGQDKPKKK